MIRHRGRTNKNDAGREFREWASLFSNGLFVMIVVYADDSGTHDEKGIQVGSREGIIGGLAAPREDWIPFCNQWQAVLTKYKVEFFHFREWRTAFLVARNAKTPPSDFHKNPYRHLNETELRQLLLNLAKIAGAGNKINVGGSVFTKRFHNLKMEGDIPADANPYAECASQFFASFLYQMELQRRPWKRQPVSFFFDQSDDKRWLHTIIDVFLKYQEKYPRWEVPAFKNKKKSPYLPLQAADMVAYRLRFMTEKWVDNDFSCLWPELDNALFKPTFDYFNAHKTEVLRAFFSGQLHYDYDPNRKPNTI